MTRYRTAKLRRIADEDVEESALDRIIREQLDQYFENLCGRQPIPLHQLVHEAGDRPRLRYALKKCDWNQSRAAELLGIHRNTLREKLRELGLYESNF